MYDKSWGFPGISLFFYLFIFYAAEEDEANVQLYEKPTPENDFVGHCIQRRKYPVLLKVDKIF